MLQVSAEAQTECKMTARVPSFDFPEKIDRAAQSLMSNLRKTIFLTVSVAFLSVAGSPTRNFFYLKKTRFFWENCCGAFLGFWLCFPVIYVPVPFFGPVPKRSLVRAEYTGYKNKKPLIPPQQSFRKNKTFNVSQTVRG